MDFTIYSRELQAIGVDPRSWTNLDQSQRKTAASNIFRRRNNAASMAAAHMIESNNPNALQRLQLVWN